MAGGAQEYDDHCWLYFLIVWLVGIVRFIENTLKKSGDDCRSGGNDHGAGCTAEEKPTCKQGSTSINTFIYDKMVHIVHARCSAVRYCTGSNKAGRRQIAF